jgi:dTDP-4-dehydrorhamnose reductase
MRDLLSHRPEWVINCAGLKTADSMERLHEVNSSLPEVCATLLPPSVRLIHASSDAVFGPWLPNRRDAELPDAEDPYGRSKCAAEAALRSQRCFIIRCSIVGPEVSTNRNLLSWFLSERSEATGYMNHSWNGITTLEWASLCCRIMAGAHGIARPLLQPGIWPATTKYELLRLARKVWLQGPVVRPAESRDPVYRTLVPNVESPALPEQLMRLKQWYRP